MPTTTLHADDAALARVAKKDKKRAREDESDEERAARRAAKKAKRAAEEAGSDEPDGGAAAAKKPRLTVAPAPATLAAATSPVETPVNGKAGPPLDTKAFLAEHSMSVALPAGVAMPAPMTTFAGTGFSPKITAQFIKAGYTAPTLTQQMAWPLTLLNRNIVTVAKTGSGKTLAFLLPVFTRLLAPGSGRVAPKPGNAGRPSMLVMAPTRELAVQIEEEAAKFGGAVGLRTTVCYGGAPKYNQCRILKGGVDVVIGTPGRLKDLLNMGVLDLGAVQYLVLDEADRMLDMGFEDDMRELCSYTPPGRQTLLFTATWPKVVERLAGELCPDPIRFSVGDTSKLTANPSIKQTIEMLSGADAKASRLQALFTQLFMKDGKPDPGHGKSIVFMAYKGACNGIAQGLWDAGFAVDTLHGDMDQTSRSRVIEQFRSGKLRVIVATDVAGRGLDVKDISHVFNFDFPLGKGGVEDYVHRIGRTGRAGATGEAITFFDPHADKRSAPELVAVMKGAKQEIPEALAALCRGSDRRAGGFGGGRGGRGGFGGRGGGRGGYGGGGRSKW